MTETESDMPQPHLRTTLPREVQSSFFAVIFIGLTLSFAGCVSLFFLTPMFRAESENMVPGFAMFSIVMAICALIARQCAGLFATRKGDRALLVLCFVCGCLGPLGMLFGEVMWWGAICVSAVGCLCVMYEWWSHLCSLEHRVLVLFVSSALLVGAAIVLVIALLGVGETAGVIITSVLLVISSVFLCFLEDGRRAALYAVDVRESFNRLRSLSMRRLGDFSYFAIGLMTAVVVELVAFIVPARFGAITNAAAIMFALAVVLIFAACFFGHWRTSFDLEGRSKDYLTLTCALGFLPLPFASGVPLFILLVYLLFIVGLQLTLVITAIIELARFEEISPLWYLGEATFLFVGMCLGSMAAKVCFLQMPGPDAISALCMGSVVFVAFAQVLFNKFSYPEIELFRSDEEEPGILAGETAGSAAGHDGGDGAVRQGLSNMGEDIEADRQKGSSRFRNRIAEISDVYGLSPRQREILELLAKGRNAGYIMDHFHISRSTVKTHVYNIYIKLEIHSRQELLDLIESDEELIRPAYL